MAAPVPPPKGAQFKTAPTSGPDSKSLSDTASGGWLVSVVEVVNRMLGGALNANLQVTMRNGFATTTILDSRITAFSALHLEPLTTNAATLKYGAPFILVTDQKSGSVTFAHANTANTDQTFIMTILG